MDGMFASRLKECRIKKQLTMKELGQALNMAQSTISGYENGTRKPDLDNLARLADYFNVSTDYLVGRLDSNDSFILHSDQLTSDEKLFLADCLQLYRKHCATNKV
jgi:transcriptional regulator with XRE-family HTH domain